MNIFLPLVTWIVLLSSTVHSQQLHKQISPFKTNLKSSRFRNEVFFLNLEDGYFGCQVNESTDYLQLYELSKLCDGNQDCFLGSDELNKELKCTNDCDKDGTQCINGVCLNGVCHCNDGWGGCNCNVQDDNECKYRPCDVFAHCTNTLGSFTCTCFPGYRGDGLHCEDIDECKDPQIAARCVENAECCNLPAHFLCKCKDGYEGDGEVLCTDIDECLKPEACGVNARCINTPGNYTCACPEGFYGSPYDGCYDVDECTHPDACGPGAICVNLEGSYRCNCPVGYEGDARSLAGCVDFDECARSPCGRNAQCSNTEGSFKCICPDGYSGDPNHNCEAACILDTECSGEEVCQGGQCINPCFQPQSCGMNALCSIERHFKQCSCPAGFTGNPEVECVRIPMSCHNDLECGAGYSCYESMCFPQCSGDQDCALNEKCLNGNCMLTCRVDNDCFLGHVCLHNKCVFGCHSDDDCSASESCRNDKCVNPCAENPCGPNAACSVANHRATCNCLEGMVPNPTPQVGCVRSPPQECNENRDCPYGLACFESVCRPLCAEDAGCLSNERCQNGACKPLCRRDDDCRNNEVCLGLSCVPGCRSDQGCPTHLSCFDQQCIDPCADARACGTNAVCEVINHTKICSCPIGLLGDAEVSCKSLITTCSSNADCTSTQLCYGGSCQKKCRNDQNCLNDERCMRGICRTVCNVDSVCPQGQICENRICQIGCRNDLNCAPDQTCINKMCKNPCDSPGQCGQCASCLVVNHGIQCSCPNGFVGDGLTGCQLPAQRCNPSCECDETGTYCAQACSRTTDCACSQVCTRGKCRAKCGANRSCPLGQLCERGACVAGCKTNNDCAMDQTCTKGQCSDPCTDKQVCGSNALCTVTDHRLLCYCPDGYDGEPTKECVQFECQHDNDCESNKKCDKGKCRNPCLEYGACGSNAQCRVVNHKPQCSCPPDFFGNPLTECQPLKGGCASNPCGINSRCSEVPGSYECSCMEGCIGDAQKGCVCEDHLVNACHDQPCGLNAACRVLQHNEAQCYCPDEFPNGDPYVHCFLTQPPIDCRTEGCQLGECVREGYDYVCKQEIGCSANHDCPSQKSCINGVCTDPCTLVNPCGYQQECKVIDHQPICSQVTGRTPGCEHCPPGTTCDPSTGACIKESPGTPKTPEPCQSNNDCIESEACYMGLCQDPCEFANACAASAKCKAKMHRPICSCPPGHVGNPTIKCMPTEKAMECFEDSDCSITEACINQRCQHPCDVHDPCAENAICVNTNHVADCNCSYGYEGNGYVGCQPAKYSPVCQYNEDCPPNKLCDRLNRRCINPCQEDSCGENAECIPVNHGIECRCLPGYVGNAYVDCTILQSCRSDSECDVNHACMNGRCSSPCNCGSYALCDVVNHRGICKCPPGYAGNPNIACSPPNNLCEPNPCGLNALCELDNGNPICYCPKGLTGNPFKNCIPEGDECTPNPCGPNSGCRLVENKPICFCLPEYEGQPPQIPCDLPNNPCDPSPCGPNTQCSVLANGFSKCTCLPGYVESPNTIRGCIEPINPCDPNPCGIGAICDSTRNPVCFCPDNKIGNPFRLCEKPSLSVELCRPNPCGRNADCYVAANREECYCSAGYVGDPYLGCRDAPRSACETNPCGPHAQCVVSGNGQNTCICPDGLSGDPTSLSGCRSYECEVDDDCSLDKACIGFRCHDPCPGACGHGTNCHVEQHHPVCTCTAGLTGNPGIFCYALDVPKQQKNPCIPSPCGLNSECKVLNNRAVCSCLQDYLGDPQSGCHPECEINSDCDSAQACINRKCVDPCAGTVCGINALCGVQQHTPICRCLDGFTGNAFHQCIIIGVLKNISRDPCKPSPCGPNDVCSVHGDGVALCDPCFGHDAEYDPRCRPECIFNSDCPFDKACLGRKCLDPCSGSCGHGALCYVYEHNPICQCPSGLYGNPYEHCSTPLVDTPGLSQTCAKRQCGANSECKRQGNALICVCRQGYFGNPYIGCRPECVLNSDCPADRACVNSKCSHVCNGVCGVNALCHVVNHAPTCICSQGYTGDPFKSCSPQPQIPLTYLPVGAAPNPCEPSPCGPNSRCLISPEGYAACSCLPGFKGSPPVCQPECIVSSECALYQACINHHCADPCPGTCGVNARCQVLNHNPICSCDVGHEGDPFIYCAPAKEKPKEADRKPIYPCAPSPCGPNSICQVKQNRPVCSCVANYIGSPPFCRPECTLNNECPADKACIREKCENPCTNTCGYNARCSVIAHSAYCSCEDGYEGDAFVGCSKIIKPQDRLDPCYANPCAENAVCSERNGVARCVCIEPYIGDPYTTGCRPECVFNSECPSHLACIKQHCRDPCIGTCGSNAECSVVNHVPTCNCQHGYVGDPFNGCKKDTQIKPISPCEPNVCGPNSICRVVDGRPTCSCQVSYLGAPPNCRPECIVSSECIQHLTCINQKCVDPCVGTCGFNAKCHTINHNPICSCPEDMTGDPFQQCLPKPKTPPPEINACIPSPCGPNAECQQVDNRAVCSCLPGIFGAPPNCRPECIIHQDCPLNRACISQRCEDPCIGACGFNAICTAQNHKPVCSCLESHEGDPYAGCNLRAIIVPELPTDPCNPSPCGSNAICRERNGAGSCTCQPDYFGDPYINCRPECVQSSDCSHTKSCLNMKCVDPCKDLCGFNAICRVANHIPLCSCNMGYTGNPLRICHKTPPTTYLPAKTQDPCRPSPCGLYSTCRALDGRAICSCLPNYIGRAPSCRPECVISAECPSDKACINQRCEDPCPGTCGNNAKCRVTNHSPICSCSPGYIGDPFHQCIPRGTPETPKDSIARPNPCIPSPCGPNSRCLVAVTGAVCSCITNYIGRPPSCRPECTISSECPANMACINSRCSDPCIGSCGNYAHCHVSSHSPVCMCEPGFTGDPFTNCFKIVKIPDQPARPCQPNPCGVNALCEERNQAAACKCIREYFGDPYIECRPQCILNADCPKSRACVNNNCVDPCPGTCGYNAECITLNHIPNCQCLTGYTGNAALGCYLLPELPKFDIIESMNPCVPSPCGPYSNCRSQNGHAVCSCQINYVGAPPNCRPECMGSSDCPQDKSCLNQHCKDTCPGTCGTNANCRVVNHNPICYCMSGFTGDPFIRCVYEEKRPIVKDSLNSCIPSPCGPNSQCRVSNANEQPVCSCLPNYIGRAPNCRPECTSNSECRSNQACVNRRCKDSCQGSCGSFTTCIVNNHRPICRCLPGYTGDPFAECSPQIIITPEKSEPCNPSPCGTNAVCKERNGVGSCTCLPEYSGDPYTECRPECVLNSDCAKNRACVNNKCRDPCPGVCGVGAECHVINHSPSCSCSAGFTGNPSEYCRKEVKPIEATQPCRPSPCGPYSKCLEVNDHAVCSCLANHIGTPPACRPECSISSECSQDRACVNLRCIDPCPGTCGVEAFCKVTNHNPICSCPSDYTGDPFISCLRVEKRKKDDFPSNPCIPSPCGPNSLCRLVGETPVCSCLPNFVGRAPNCRPECSINSECPANLACINEVCKDPCPGSCGFNAICNVVNHSPLCTCDAGYSGDPFAGCAPAIPPEEHLTPCNPSPCGANAECRERNSAGSCTCIEGYFGDPYSGCRPECVVNSDCPRDKSCNNNKCTDPCPGVCGINAECRISNHVPTCHCSPGYTGNPLSSCRVIPDLEPTPISKDVNPCIPSPCGPYSQCREINGHAVCSCLTTFIGSPPNCRPECIISSDCAQNMACQNQKCIDPCPGTCGTLARCQVINHYAACSCPPGYTGDPFNSCSKMKLDVISVENTGDPCIPSPCGPNSKCIDVGGSPACSCLSSYMGRPPNCRPECMSSSDCPANLACMNQKCSNPCVGTCGVHTLCTVIKHNPTCQCELGYTGDPFSGCAVINIISSTERPRDPCNPSPCGANAVCRERNGVGSCSCLTEYFGDPYSGCRPECVQNSDCDRSKACLNNKCQDPCPGVCGINAECRVLNHAPNCYCFEGYSGDPHRSCSVIEVTTITPLNPCQPSPCGPYSECRETNGHAVCSCLDNYVGAPPSCRPECVVSSECPQNRACIQQKCGDPCKGACGSKAKCQVVNHNPICTCPLGMTGDPFAECIVAKSISRDSDNPCVPSPCGPNSLCREIAGQAACSCQANYIGRPPNCRPECTNNDECQNYLSCQNEKCVDPCPGSCGSNAVCKVIQHNAVCSCADGYEGDPVSGCSLIPPVLPKQPPSSPCEPSPCGPHSECRERNGAGACYCHEGYEGNPYDTERGCRRECESNEDCSPVQSCVRFKCVDPCVNICGELAMCSVENHVPTCMCPPAYTGDPFFQCKQIPITPAPILNPCVPSPCGPNSICRNINDQAVCSCQSGFINQPPNCKPECIVSSECAAEKACIKNKCMDPCLHTCGHMATCVTKNHSPICTCPKGMTGDPFVRCSKMPHTIQPEPTERPPSCVPSPCGPNSKCQIIGGSPACSCLPDFIGTPPGCRPECVLNSECGPTDACINQKCRDPCPGSCGFEAKCHVLNHLPICNCLEGYTGDPFIRCSPVPVTESPKIPNDPCDPNPCGANADCYNGECRCHNNYQGNPYDGCRPECTLSADCAQDKACIRNKCVNPCPGTCGLNAICEVLNHIPVCSCVKDYEGDPFTNCRLKEQEPEKPVQLCSPSPCGPNSQCKNVNDHAVCSCLDGFMGAPPQCRPECVVSSECSALQACVNKKCVDPCSGACGINARCEVINHSPICGCPLGKTGDPFKRCLDLPPPPKTKQSEKPQDPCLPSPCGPNSICKASANGPSCQCLPEFFGSPPNCRPECIINPDCPSTQACINNKCRDPCPGSCGTNAECRIISHSVSCSCPSGFAGNAFVQCVQQKEEPIKPCEPSPCGPNAECIERNGAASCRCIDEYQGNPYEGCRPECVLSSDCPTDQACIRNKCKDPCPGICGSNALCYAVNHVPNCVCDDGYTGDPFSTCQPEPKLPPPKPGNPCQPSPCGPNSKCREANSLAVCSCLDAFIGTPPNCKPECTVNAECTQTKACHKFKCANPCAGTCGIDAKCEVINHNPICSCPLGMTGDPFTRCYPAPQIPVGKDKPIEPRNPCLPSPCGLYSECRVNGDQASCSCLPNYIGAPPNCRPECVVNTDCSSDRSCIAEKCRNPCDGSCGINSECRIQNHLAICTCRAGFTGDPFSQCVEIIEEKTQTPIYFDPCGLQPCGANAECQSDGTCICFKDYHGDPYSGCRPECTLSTDCSPHKACLNKKCVDPCPGTCGQSAQCSVSNHIPICSCAKGYTGDPFINCRQMVRNELVPVDPCQPNPCGPNSLCHVLAQGAVCACQPGMLGSPPTCKPECIVSSECSLQTACISKKCVDPCPGACGQFAKCQIINHNPICTCNDGYTGDPFTRCYQETKSTEPTVPIEPCIPSPCGPNSECRVVGDSPACSCMHSFIGTPPNCRPECTINPECHSTKACIRQKCEDPCVGSCGFNAHCTVANHMPICTCEAGYTGDPFSNCQPIPVVPPQREEPKNPCRPSPCGSNADCQVRGNSYSCECIKEYFGNPYEGCRPECVGNSECPANRACIKNKCADPCPGTCGLEAVCSINNHIPICSCPQGLTGNAFLQCSPTIIPEITLDKPDPCYPTPCGQNTICKVQRDQGICECLPGFFGNPYGHQCLPECTLSSDCAKDKACVNSKCLDPCPGVCGYGALCRTVNHNPICSCSSSMVGNPFIECHPAPKQQKPFNPCDPSPCRINGICRVVNDIATCIYPECVTNEDCSRDRTCINQKCRDPCINSCGLNSICNAVNHKAVCTCPPGFYGSPYSQCLQQVDVMPVSKPECFSDSDCTNDKACVNGGCKNPCELGRVCGQNSRCHVQFHRPLCVCNEGYTGNALNNCHLIGCQSNKECSPTEACINNECTSPCLYTQCGANAECRTDYSHKARCHCLDGYNGNPLVHCTRPECNHDEECAFNLACRNERCEDPCNCGINAQCRVNSHRAQCRCPPGYVGDPLIICKIEEIKVAPQCSSDADCSSKLACFSGVCKNPCLITKPCGNNAVCSVVDTLPLRTMMCECERGYAGDADVGCRKEPVHDQGCQTAEDCGLSETCRKGNCVNPCVNSSPCARTAECLVQNHRAVCTCPKGTQGDPFVNCYQPSQITTGCSHDSQCAPTTACVNKQCQDPCAESNPCANNAECRVHANRPICSCPTGWGGNPQVQCFKSECKINGDCPYDNACVNEHCVNPCTHGSIRCGTNALCEPQNHQAVCMCPPGTQGNAFVSCITGHCQYNEDCADYEACDRLNRVCRPVCDDDTCAINALCLAKHHQPQCQCKVGLTGNPYEECLQPKQPLPAKPLPECTQDADCSTQLACINQQCSNPCTLSHVCPPQQSCIVLDTLPLRTMVCKCPPDTISDTAENCVPIRYDTITGCQGNDECANSEVCQQGSCIDACRLEHCGLSAQCHSKDHYAECSCSKGYQGNPRIECRPVEYEEPKLSTAECIDDDDCLNEKICRNEQCINPCLGDVCGHGAYCYVERRVAKCRCPPGYNGDPKINCTPPPNVSVVECNSNSDCQSTESCVNERCINPCNCGFNAECKVHHHHPACYCKRGFSGNPQYECIQIGCQSDDDCSLDKTCINHECVDPCLINDICGANAECYGRNHLSACRCPNGLEGGPFDRCIHVQCTSDNDCSSNEACIRNVCIDPCKDVKNPCAHNALCQAMQHRAVCRCPEELPLGNPYSFCERLPISPLCRTDSDCSSGLACINTKCGNPCTELSPCHSSAQCNVLDSVPVRTMVCECATSYVPDERGECRHLPLLSPLGCATNSDCTDQEVCINRQCRDPCNCGENTICQVQNHRATCSCRDGFGGNPYTSCHSIGCRYDIQCGSERACVNSVCINPCLIHDICGTNAECYVQSNRAMCRCKSGFRGDPYQLCKIIGCQTNSDCSSDKICQQERCIDPCIYQNICSPRAECKPQNHMAVCRCLPTFVGNPYIDCRPEPEPTCKADTDCPARLACINDECVDPCLALEPCNRPAECEVTPTAPVRTMICICPDGYISSGSGTCKPTKTVSEVGGCIADTDCSTDRSCVNGVCRNPCNCGLNSECRIKDHKPVCSCRQGFEGNPEFECSRVECSINSDCQSTHACRNQQCIPACQKQQCGINAKCLAVDHKAICECISGFRGNARISCSQVGCRTDSDCPSDRACINDKCENPCETTASCAIDEICKVYQHRPQCACPPNTSATRNGCEPLRDFPLCHYDGDCPTQMACIRSECVDPCNATQPCGVNAKCRVLDTLPVRTMICECLESYTGNAAVQCDKRSLCFIEKGFVRDTDGQCVCPPGTALDIYEYCTPCLVKQGFKIDETGHCVCALERGFVIDERGRCICPTDYGYTLTNNGDCIPQDKPECQTNDDCADNRYCNLDTRTCKDPCLPKTCGVNAFCNAINHRAQCQCIAGYTGNADTICNHTNFRTDFPRPDMVVSCLADGVQVEIHITEPGFNGVLYVKGHSKDEECRRVVNLAGETVPRTEIFRVHFGSCGMQAVKDVASFVLVIQKHPKLVTYKAQAYNIKCVYQTGEKNVTLGFNVSMLTTAGTIANTGPPPICQMRIITHDGEEINSAEIGDNLKLQVDVEPATIYGGFARSCIAKTMEDNIENEYIVTDENGCATDPSIFGEWEYNPDTNSLLANFNAFKFPSSDNIRFQCNIRVCFGKCQPVNCRDYNAFGRRRRRAIADNSTDDATAIATNTGIEGQLREEITISSNAILTFEKRTTTSTNDSNIKPSAQRVEDICVSMVGLIIALVITALLALVAVAVAVSCWLMAYRRRPKTLAPLPHPPEFPNPLFTNPEAVPEPTPDYLS